MPPLASLNHDAVKPVSTSTSDSADSCRSTNTPVSSMASSTALSSSYSFGPIPVSARSGRSQQRYAADGERLVAGCIPIRYLNDSGTMEAVEVCLITSSGGRGLVLPKGGWEDDETVEVAAQRETVEEAGVLGYLEEPMLGTFPFQSVKQERLHSVHHGKCVAHMYIMIVTQELDAWPESPDRQRFWVPLAEAAGKCRHAWMRQAISHLVTRKGWSLPSSAFLLEPTASGHCTSITSEASDTPDTDHLTNGYNRASFDGVSGSSPTLSELEVEASAAAASAVAASVKSASTVVGSASATRGDGSDGSC